MTRQANIVRVLMVALLFSAFVSIGCRNDRTSTLRGPTAEIQSVTPSRGPAMGGTPITIIGSGFQMGANVEVGGTAAPAVTYVSESEIATVTPAGAPGPADVLVINPDSTFGEAPGGFVYQGSPPQILSITPDRGPTVGGTGITIAGSDFQAGATVTIGGIPASGITVNVPAQILATTPPGTDGPADVTVINPDLLSDNLPGGFIYGTAAPPPSITSIAPDDGPIGGGTIITIVGDNFQPGAQIELGGIAVLSAGFVSSTVLTGVTDVGVFGFVDVVVRNPDGQSDTLIDGFEYTGNPLALFRILPWAGDMAAPTPVTIEGAGFTADTQVTIGGNSLLGQSIVDLFTITGSAPPSAITGKVDVVATNSVGMDILPDAFTYTVGPPVFPIITALVPPQGPIASRVDIQGVNFGSTPGANLVTFDGLRAPVLLASPSNLLAVVPPGARTGPVNVEVNFVPSNDVDFTVTSPRIRFVSPAAGAVGDPAAIIGENFSPNPLDNEVRFHGTLAAVVAATPTHLVTHVPVGTVSGPVTVKIAGYTTPGVDFCVTPPAPPDPALLTISPTSGGTGSSVTITGADFSTIPSNNLVRFNGVIGTVASATVTSMTVTVPASATTGPVTVVVEGRPAPSSPTFTVTSPSPPAPAITAIYPDSGEEGDAVYIEGSNFDPEPRSNVVQFNGVAAEVAAGSSDWLLASVPFTSTGPLTVGVGGQASNGMTFTITGLSAGALTADFFGQSVAIPSDRVTYLIDASGTMAWTFGAYTDRFGTPVTGTRLDLIKDRVISSIQGLPSTARFNVIAFDCATYAWSGVTLDANTANKTGAEAWVDALVPLGGTGTGPAVSLALEERENRTILIASDGQASCGPTGVEGHLCEALAANEQGAVIHTFAIDTFGEFQQFLHDLAALTGGTSTDIVP
ncbi:MAG: IPT/TIG domain-containing protein [Planctomycetota bacterium]|nr:IPT/TIG domain-containing protein [Planctomycetota bacterium]